MKKILYKTPCSSVLSVVNLFFFLCVFVIFASLCEKMGVNALPPIEVQRDIIEKIETERKMVDGCRELIALYEQKIKRIVEGVWG